jgi:hypothetical protein
MRAKFNGLQGAPRSRFLISRQRQKARCRNTQNLKDYRATELHIDSHHALMGSAQQT